MHALEAATPGDYESYLRAHVVPFLASRSLDEIDRTSFYERRQPPLTGGNEAPKLGGGRLDGCRLNVQAKRWEASVGRPVVQVSLARQRVEGRRDAAPPRCSPQPVVADQVSVLPNVPGQAPSGHGAGSASVPAASDAARYV